MSTNDQWATLLRDELAKQGKRPTGDGWMTFDELKEKHDAPANKMRKALRALKDAGKIEVFKGAVIEDGVTHPRVWYRPTNAEH